MAAPSVVLCLAGLFLLVGSIWWVARMGIEYYYDDNRTIKEVSLCSFAGAIGLILLMCGLKPLGG